jgi:cobalt-zinc-cadmium efflux system outer membrane protein
MPRLSQRLPRTLPAFALLLTAALAGCVTSTPWTESERQAYTMPPEVPLWIRRAPSDASAPGASDTDQLSNPLTLESLLAATWRSSPAVAAARHDWSAAVKEIGASARLPDASAGYWETHREALTHLAAVERGLFIEQQITNPWKLAAREGVATADAMAGRVAYLQTLARVRADVALGFLDIQELDARMGLLQELLVVLKTVEDLIAANLPAGITSQAQLLRAQVARDELKSQLEMERLQRPSLVSRLAALTGRFLAADAKVAPLVQPQSSRPLLPLELLRERLEEHPAIAMGLAAEKKVAEQLREASADRIPDLTVGVDHARGDRSELTLRAGITIPWQSGSYSAREDSITAKAEAARRRTDGTRRDLRALLDRELYRLADAERMRKLYTGSILTKARHALELAESDFTVGKASLSDVLDAERSILAGELVLIRARADAERADTEIVFLTGESVWERAAPPVPAGVPGK